MELQGLYELHERLIAAAVAGVNLVGEDFRLRRAVEQIKPLAEAVPVIKKLYAMAEKTMAPDCEDRAGCLLDTLALSEAILCTQAGCGLESETAPLKLVTRQYQPCLPYSVEAPLEKALTQSGGGRLVPITEAMKEKKEVFGDYRLQAAAVTALSDRYSDIAEAVEAFLSNGEKEMIPLLKMGFQDTTENGRVHRLCVIEALAGAKENDFYLEVLEHARKDLRQEAIHALRFKEENVSLLLDLARTEKGGCLEMTEQVLGMINTEETDAYWEAQLAKKPIKAAGYLCFSKSDAVSDKIAGLIREAFASEKDDRGKEREQWIGTLICALPGKASEKMQEIYREAAMGKFKYRDTQKEFAQALMDSVIYSGDERLMALARELAASSSDRFWLAPALAADFLTKPAAEVMETYRDKVPGEAFLALGREGKRRGKLAILTVLGRIRYARETGTYEMRCRIEERVGSWKSHMIKRKLCEAPDPEWYKLLKEEKIFGEKTVIGFGRSEWLQEINRDEVLASLLSVEDRKKAGEYFYQRALCAKNNGNLCNILLECGWDNFEGVVAAYVKKNTEEGISMWRIQRWFADFPFSEEQKQREIREIDRILCSFPRGSRERRNWDSNEERRREIDLAAGLAE